MQLLSQSWTTNTVNVIDRAPSPREHNKNQSFLHVEHQLGWIIDWPGRRAQLEKHILKKCNQWSNKKRAWIFFYKQVILRLESLCANLHGATDGEELISLLSETPKYALLLVPGTHSEVHNLTHTSANHAQKNMTLVYYFNRARGALCNKLNWGEPLSLTSSRGYYLRERDRKYKGQG